MRPASAWLLLCTLLVSAARDAAAARDTPAAAAGATQRSFVIFDGLQYAGKSNLQAKGLPAITWVGDLWRPGVSHDTVDESQVRAIFASAGERGGFYYLDIENWPLQPPATRAANIGKLAQVIDLARRAAPHVQIGFYGILPDITYWPLIRHDADYERWLQVNRAVAPLASRVDAVFPSLYTFYDDAPSWKNYAAQTLTEARRYGKPVYAFLWPEFHDSTPRRGQALQRTLWRAELDLCAAMADGVVLWGGWQEHWDENAPWWQETLAFMNALDQAHRRLDHAPR